MLRYELPLWQERKVLATAILDLYFVKGDFAPSNAQVMIGAYSTTENGKPLITPEAMSFSEFEGYVNRLHQDLDELLEQARRQFSN